MNTKQIKIWLIQMGSASWHQRKAGHFYSSSLIFTGTKAESYAWVERYKKNNPMEPCVAIEQV